MFAPTHPLQLVLGLIIWSAWFVLIYAVLSIACSAAPSIDLFSAINWINGLLLLLTTITCALLVFFSLRCWRVATEAGNHRFVARVAAGIYLVAAVSTLAIGLPILVLPPCL